MFNIGAGEIAVIAVVALLVLGPSRLPELARGIGKFLREFRRQTDEVRTVVEREFYKMDRELLTESSDSKPPTLSVPPAEEVVPFGLEPRTEENVAAGSGETTATGVEERTVTVGMPLELAGTATSESEAPSSGVAGAEPVIAEDKGRAG